MKKKSAGLIVWAGVIVSWLIMGRQVAYTPRQWVIVGCMFVSGVSLRGLLQFAGLIPMEECEETKRYWASMESLGRPVAKSVPRRYRKAFERLVNAVETYCKRDRNGIAPNSVSYLEREVKLAREGMTVLTEDDEMVSLEFQRRSEGNVG